MCSGHNSQRPLAIFVVELGWCIDLRCPLKSAASPILQNSFPDRRYSSHALSCARAFESVVVH